jgi:rRNA-processing protein FCF1
VVLGSHSQPVQVAVVEATALVLMVLQEQQVRETKVELVEVQTQMVIPQVVVVGLGL